jgi:hypothetical protein
MKAECSLPGACFKYVRLRVSNNSTGETGGRAELLGEAFQVSICLSVQGRAQALQSLLVHIPRASRCPQLCSCAFRLPKAPLSQIQCKELRANSQPGHVAHICNSSYLRGRDGKDSSSRLAWTKSS